ncbi:LysM peptidoglycan-binding domain-containing protein [Glutamicibacter sp. JL.03c]|uniref:LysM peptidoglycan-binding domain-containing protein n=1 Tax=Glutamicibacter sp. JL.03c TaxID=2984842 RepID=UPI0021F72662|nr:LysM peptidoglycan-binding domain-containing protein [Glutamicibacter sp. JL.03c]UYQ78552.1 LysM peptidoglycan-binding domain-containing protein [Glutamicibacter sp. JL.03c]
MATVALDSNQTRTPMKIRINRRGWAVLVGIPVFALTVAAAFFFSMFASNAHASSELPTGVETIDVTVIPGDTVWSLAKEYSQGYDVTSAVNHISELNSLQGSEIHVGDSLSIPVLAG